VKRIRFIGVSSLLAWIFGQRIFQKNQQFPKAKRRNRNRGNDKTACSIRIDDPFPPWQEHLSLTLLSSFVNLPAVIQANPVVQIQRAIITAAGANQRQLPLQTLVDRDGETKTALAILLEEVIAAGIEEVCLVISPGDQASYETAAGELAGRIQFVEQAEQLGYGHAVWCAREFAAGQPFLLLVSDHLYVSGEIRGCARQLIEAAQAENCAVSAVQATHESKLPNYGAVGGHLVTARQGLYEISEVMEKPSPTQAEQSLLVPGLRAGHYLCFFGMHVLTSQVMDLLDEDLKTAGNKSVHLSSALSRLTSHERYLASELTGRRYDIGDKYGLLTAQLAIALDGSDRDEVLTHLVELLATSRK
jgi:UTP--glucose-1-phosphate uridylyltransferase